MKKRRKSDNILRIASKANRKAIYAGHALCDAKMYHMKTVSVRDLRYDFKMVERILREGEEVQITKRRKPIARLIPETTPRPALPDFMAQLRAIYGDKVSEVTGAEIVRMDRDRY
jgi:antitoxin (DNA-binding transcriptional repressor) of toxin-antitoxin stability system